MTAQLKDRVTIVTGAGSGIGRALSLELGRQGARVVATDLDAESAANTAEEIGRAGGSARAEALDVTDADGVEDVVARTVEADGRIDVMVNNAGIAVVGEAHETTRAQWRKLVEVNVMGVVHGVQAAYPRMKAQGDGHILNIASLAGLAPAPSFTAYSATKHAVVGLSTSLRAEAADFGVRVSAACPGFIDTPIAQNAEYVGVDGARLNDSMPLKMASPELCARTVVAGLRRNKAIITVTAFARISWWVWRAWPWLSGQLAIRGMRDVRTRGGVS